MNMGLYAYAAQNPIGNVDLTGETTTAVGLMPTILSNPIPTMKMPTVMVRAGNAALAFANTPQAKAGTAAFFMGIAIGEWINSNTGFQPWVADKLDHILPNPIPNFKPLTIYNNERHGDNVGSGGYVIVPSGSVDVRFGKPNSIATVVVPDQPTRAIRNIIYDENGNYIGEVNFQNHRKGMVSGHGHKAPTPGDIRGAHQDVGHIKPENVPESWSKLPDGITPETRLGD